VRGAGSLGGYDACLAATKPWFKALFVLTRPGTSLRTKLERCISTLYQQWDFRAFPVYEKLYTIIVQISMDFIQTSK
jgi:hypothetical protein